MELPIPPAYTCINRQSAFHPELFCEFPDSYVLVTSTGQRYIFCRYPPFSPDKQLERYTFVLSDAYAQQLLRQNCEAFNPIFSLRELYDFATGYITQGSMRSEQVLFKQLVTLLTSSQLLVYEYDNLLMKGVPPEKLLVVNKHTKSSSDDGKAAMRSRRTTASSSRSSADSTSKASATKPAERYRAPIRPGPDTFDQAEARLKEARQHVMEARANGAPLPGSGYTTADKKKIVAEGLNERFLVRIVKKDHAIDDGYIGKVLPGQKRVQYWTTTFTQAEHGDTDPEAICSAVGVDYDPKSEYTILLIDHKRAAEVGDMYTFIPTYGRIGGFAKQELASEFKGQEHLIDLCLTPEYSQRYEEAVVAARAAGTDLDNADYFAEFCQEKGYSAEEADILAMRHQIKERLGANEHFLGNGMLKDLSVDYDETPFGDADDGTEYGPCETISCDKNPKTLKELEQKKALRRIHLSNS